MNKSKISNNNLWDKGRDKALFAGLKRRDEKAFMKVYERYVDDIYRFIYFKVGNAEEANDITSDVFLKTWGHIKNRKLEQTKTLKSFVYTVARNCVVDHYRKQPRKQRVDIDGEDSTVDIVDENQNVARQMEIDSDMNIIRDKMKELKEEYKEVIILRYINELSFAEIARITGRSKNSARVVCHRALKTLKELMDK